MNTRAVIFDLFGVLVTDGFAPFKKRYFGNDVARLRQAEDLDKQANRGFLAYQDFEAQLATLAGVSKEEVREQLERNAPNDELLGFIAANLKPKFKVGLLSNSAQNWLSELLTPEQVKLFDAVVLSCDIGAGKPEPQAYRAVAQKLGLKPEECLFIDDQQRYASGAQAVGMQSFQYKDNSDTLTRLNTLLSPN